MIIKYNKLVRDRIPEMIETAGNKCQYAVLSDQDYVTMLQAKLTEEVAEYHKDQTVEELADLLEVIYALAKTHNMDSSQLERLRLQKREKRGGFDNKILLIQTEITEE